MKRLRKTLRVHDDACNHDFDSLKEYREHRDTALHKIEVARKEINHILTVLELQIREAT